MGVEEPVPLFASPLFGSEAQALLAMDGLYAQEPIVKGAAVSFSSDPSKPLDIFNYGNPLAVSELLGVVNSTPRAPGLQSLGNGEETLQVIRAGRCAVLLAPGEIVRKGQFLEPMGSIWPGLWHAVPGKGQGSFQSLEMVDNSGGSQPVFVSGDLFPSRASTGLLGMILTPSPVLQGDVLAGNEGAFAPGMIVPKNLMIFGKKLKISAVVDFVGTAAGEKAIVGVRLGGLTGLLLASTSTAGGGTAISKGDQSVVSLELDIQASGLLGKLISLGMISIGTLGTAPMLSAGATGPLTLNTTIDQLLVLTVTFAGKNAVTQAVLRALSVEVVV